MTKIEEMAFSMEQGFKEVKSMLDRYEERSKRLDELLNESQRIRDEIEIRQGVLNHE